MGYLSNHDVSSTHWSILSPTAPNWFFVPQITENKAEYESAWSLNTILETNTTGFVTGRDSHLIRFSASEIELVIREFADPKISDQTLNERYEIKDTSGWPVTRRRQELLVHGFEQELIRSVDYRPFDKRYIYFSNLLQRARMDKLVHLTRPNLALIASRIVKGEPPQHAFVTKVPVEKIFLSPKTSNNAFVFPLYLYPPENDDKGKAWTYTSAWQPDRQNANRTPNLSPTFIADLEARLGLRFQPIQRAAAEGEFGPEDVFHYLYAVLHSPTYRARYAEFLKIDFPRVPLTSDPALFWALAAIGGELVALHLLESPAVAAPITRYPVPGDNRVEKGYPKFTQAHDEPAGRVHINPTQYFDNVPPEVWAFHVGGYQVLDKWLKDRRGRQLSYDELTHYQRVVVALKRTMERMEAIDAVIPAWPIQ